MHAANIISFSDCALHTCSKRELIHMVLSLRTELDKRDSRIIELEKKLSEKEIEFSKIKIGNINKAANQPTSKQAEFEKNTANRKNKKKSKRRIGRKGAGNRSKLQPEIVNYNPLTHCPNCQSNLTEEPAVDSVSRIIEDIPQLPEKTIISEDRQERKWCRRCAKVVSATSEAALPRSDIGLRSLCLIAYLWVVSAISLPGIARFLSSFFHLRLSTTGLSKMLIRLGKIMQPVYEEILNDMKRGTVIFADETGWRVKGVLWWLWIFAHGKAAYYFPSRQRGSPVVEKILGSVFSGVLVTDAWCAYMKIICVKQTCMAHIMRKIRAFRDAYPQYRSILSFYIKLRRILLDGERLKLSRKELGEEVFSRRLNLLKSRLRSLLSWKNPNKILEEMIAKVARQKEHILTYVEYADVPSHNNFGEYIIKKGILKRKVSGGSMSEAGVFAYGVIQSIAQTCHLRKLSFAGFLKTSLIHYIRYGKPLLLRQYESQ